MKPQIMSIFPSYQSDCFLGSKGETAVSARNGIPHTHVDLPPPIALVEATEVCLPFGSCEVLLQAVYKGPGRAEIIEL
jgi:hypothetical protein